MSHDNAAFEQLSAFLDGMLSPDEARAVQEQLETSDEYRALHEQLASARTALREIPPPRVPDDLLLRIQSEARAEMARSASIWDRWRVPVAAFAAAAAVLLAVFAPWQALHQQNTHDAIVTGESVAMVEEGPLDQPADAALEVDESPAVEVAEVSAADSAASAATDAPEEVVARSPARRAPRRVVRQNSAPASTPDAPEAPHTPAAEQPEETVASAPALASAPSTAEPSLAASGPLLGESRQRFAVAVGPRTTVEVEPHLRPAAPSALEEDMIAGVVAGMVLDQFMAQHLVENSATMLSVVTDMPTSELGPALAGDEDESGSFGFSFTDAMRRALTESEDQLP